MPTINRNLLPYRQGTSAIILDDTNQILLIQKVSYQDNEWDIPGGGIDPGETPEQTILRELQEELGSQNFEILKTSSIINQYEWPDKDIIKRQTEKKENYRGQQKTQFLVKFKGDKSEMKAQVSEIKLVKWVSATVLKQYFVFPNQFDNIAPVLKEFGIEL